MDYRRRVHSVHCWPVVHTWWFTLLWPKHGAGTDVQRWRTTPYVVYFRALLTVCAKRCVQTLPLAVGLRQFAKVRQSVDSWTPTWTNDGEQQRRIVGKVVYSTRHEPAPRFGCQSGSTAAVKEEIYANLVLYYRLP